MTIARALLIKLMQQYVGYAYRLTLLEIQKLAYFLQESGLDLRLQYVKHIYGPYAHNLNKVLEIMEGNDTRCYGDTQKPDVKIELGPNAGRHADLFLIQHPEAQNNLNVVADLVDGFETPYGMELLSSIPWLGIHDKAVAVVDSAIVAMARWNERKRKLFKPAHIRVAWDHRQTAGWIRA